MIMILTGKCYDDFNNWVHKTHDDNFDGSYGKRLFYISSLDDYKFIETDHYIYNIGDSMLNALIIEFFDSKNIFIEVSGIFYQGFEPEFNYNIQEKGTLNGINGEVFNSRQQAINKAIIKANEIYNETKA